MIDGTQPRDHAPGDVIDDDTDDVHHSNSLEQNVKSKATWLRLFFMLVFAGLYFVSRIVLFAVVIVQFFWLLFNGVINEALELARTFSNDDSVRFVNGILDAIRRRLERE